MDKLLELNSFIKNRKFVSAQGLIDNMLALEWESGRIPKSGEFYWKKLLIETGSSDNIELLLRKKKPLQEYSAFNNAKKYANAVELIEYESIERAESFVVESLINLLFENEIETKRKTGVENKFLKYKQELNQQKNLIQKNITDLEKIERLIHEQFIDCTVISNEYRYSLSDLHEEAREYMQALNNMIVKVQNEISLEAKESEETQLNSLLSDSNVELENLKHLVTNDLRYSEYNRLISEQKSICLKINQNLIDLKKIQSETEQLVKSIEPISKEYADARLGVYESNYIHAISLLSQARVDEIIKQSFMYGHQI